MNYTAALTLTITMKNMSHHRSPTDLYNFLEALYAALF